MSPAGGSHSPRGAPGGGLRTSDRQGPAGRHGDCDDRAGEACGPLVERVEVAQTNEFAGMSPAELRAEVIRQAKELGLDRDIAGLLEAPKPDPGLN